MVDSLPWRLTGNLRVRRAATAQVSRSGVWICDFWCWPRRSSKSHRGSARMSARTSLRFRGARSASARSNRGTRRDERRRWRRYRSPYDRLVLLWPPLAGGHLPQATRPRKLQPTRHQERSLSRRARSVGATNRKALPRHIRQTRGAQRRRTRRRRSDTNKPAWGDFNTSIANSYCQISGVRHEVTDVRTNDAIAPR